MTDLFSPSAFVSNALKSSSVASPSQGLQGELRVPSDKSISHRSLMFASLSQGSSVVEALLPSADVLSTAACMEALGAQIQVLEQTETAWKVSVQGCRPWKEPAGILDCGNSGTTLRLMTGLLAGQGLFCVLSGDASLNRRPMRRVLEPLKQMGANVLGRQQNQNAPVVIQPMAAGKLKGLHYTLPVASAQVKSALLLAALYAEGTTQLECPLPSRDHTERFFKALGVTLLQPTPTRLELPGQQADRLRAFNMRVPADPSSAAFPLVAALLCPNSNLLLKEVCVNPTRTGLFLALQKVGAQITFENQRLEAGEPIADLRVVASELKGDLHLSAKEIPAMVDEIPILMIAGLYLNGTLHVEGAEELRHKESDRLQAMASELAKLGVSMELTHDGFRLQGQPDRSFPQELHNVVLESWHDHRIAMALSVLNLVACQRQGLPWQEETLWPLKGKPIINVSYPGFFTQLKQALGLAV
jgi:3-phosphoshikimate 1-carboxyvinyltransferase